MANKNFLKAVLGTAGMLAAALVLGMAVAGCDDGTQDVNVVDKKTDGPSNVKAIQTTDKNSVILSWEAASGASDYTIYYRKDGKKTINTLWGADNRYIYADDDGNESDNDDEDKWSAKWDASSFSAVKYWFGISAEPIDSAKKDSDIVWTSLTIER